MKRHHQSKRGMGGFEVHKRERGTGDAARRDKRAWRFVSSGFNPMDPHARKVQRLHALPGEHVRQVKEPVKSTHGRVF